MAEAAAAVTVAAVVCVAVQFVVARAPLPYPSHLPRALLALAAAVLLTGLVATARLGRPAWTRTHTVLTWAGLAALTTVGLAIPLNGTLHYLGGTAVDQQFRVQYLTRLTNSPALADMTYADLPAYYPAGWFWIGGRIADALGVPGWEMYKPYAIVTMAVAAALAFTVWTVVVPRTTAALLSAATAVIGLQVGAYEPYNWVVASLLAPIAVITWRAVGRGGATRTPALVGIGLFVGLCAAVYALFTALTVLMIVVMAGLLGVTGRVAWTMLVRRMLVIALSTLPLALPQWLSYLSSWIAAGRPSGAATRFLPLDSAELPVPMLQFSLLGVLCLVGAAWMVVAFRTDTTAQALGILAGTCYLWFGLSTVAVAFGQTLLAFRLEPVLETVFVAAGVLGLVDLLRRLPAVLPERSAAPALAGASALSVLALLSLVQTIPFNAEAYTSYYPTGRTPLGQQDPAASERWNAELIATIDRMGGEPPERQVLLTAQGSVLSFVPYRSFLSATPHYSNPLADYDGRRTLVESWARSADSTTLVAQLDTSPVRPPTVFVLRDAVDGLRLPMSRDLFPREPNVEGYEVVFAPQVFSGPQFHTARVGPYTVAVRR